MCQRKSSPVVTEYANYRVSLYYTLTVLELKTQTFLYSKLEGLTIIRHFYLLFQDVLVRSIF